jgi:hypothetical protein
MMASSALAASIAAFPEVLRNHHPDEHESGPALAKPYEPQAVVDQIKRLLAERASRK